MTLDYALCKELKEHGFPLKIVLSAELTRIQNESVNIDGTWYESPLLEELIEACGVDFYDLVKSRHIETKKVMWAAFAGDKDYFSKGCGEGKIPAEAVANLWLALKK